MRFEGRLTREGKFWLAEVPVLGVMTQGRSRSHAHEMIRDAIETLLFDQRPGIRVHPGEGNRFEISSESTGAMIALALCNNRSRGELSLSEMSRRLGRSSRNAFARYENGETVPTITKLEELFRAVDPKRELVLGLSEC